jgi:hypothetical protein
MLFTICFDKSLLIGATEQSQNNRGKSFRTDTTSGPNTSAAAKQQQSNLELPFQRWCAGFEAYLRPVRSDSGRNPRFVFVPQPDQDDGEPSDSSIGTAGVVPEDTTSMT